MKRNNQKKGDLKIDICGSGDNPRMEGELLILAGLHPNGGVKDTVLGLHLE